LVALGLLVAGMAVPGRARRLLPRPLGWTGLLVAALAEVTVLVLACPELGVILPIARVAALVWLVAAGLQLGRALPRPPS
jgi:hypothetical protein